MAAAAALAEAIASLDVRFGARTVTAVTAATETTRQRRSFTDTSFDRISGGIGPGEVVSLTGEGTCGKVTLALRAVAGAQRDGGMALWIDPARSFDALAAHRSGVALARLIVVRPRSRDEILLAAGAGLRGDGFRMVVVDLGPSFAQICSADALAPVVPRVRGSTAALVVVSDLPAMRIVLPTFAFERAGWETRHGRTTGWSVSVRRLGDARSESALLKAAV
jgi:predicted ATP-dependent serine protease